MERICSPTTVWRSISRRSAGVSGPRLLRIASGTAILPMSWKIAAKRSVCISCPSRPSLAPTCRAQLTTVREWLAV